MPPAPKITKQQHEYILRELAKPARERPSQRTLAKKLEITQSSVSDWGLTPLSWWDKRPAAEPDSPPEVAGTPQSDAIKKLLKKQAMSAEDLADALDCSPKRVRELVSGMQAAGAMITAMPGGHYAMTFSAGLDGGKAEAIGSDEEWTHHFGITSDNHLCNMHSRLDVLNDAYDYFEAHGISRVFQGGNWCDGEMKFNRTELITPPGMDAQLDYLIDKWPVRPGIVTEFIAGDDHEGWWQQREGIEVGRYLQMRCEKQGRHDLKYLGYGEADIELKYRGGSAVARLVHPGGGSAYAISYTDQKRVESYQGGEKPQIEMAGHYHKFNYGFPREVHTVQLGCTCDQTMFLRKKRIQAHVGFLDIKIKQDPDDGTVTRFAVEWHPYFDRGYYQRKFVR